MKDSNRSHTHRRFGAKAYLLSLGLPLLALASFSCTLSVPTPADTGASTGANDTAPDANEPGPEANPGAQGGFITPDPAAPNPGDPSGDESQEKSDDSDVSEDSEGQPGGAEPESEEEGESGKSEEKSKDSEKGSGSKPSKILAEADVVHVEGDTVYALSRYSGLHILDLKNPAKIKLLGSKKIEGEPFEMYVRGQEVVVMVRDQFFYDLGDKAWKPSSSLLRFNSKDPAKIALIDETRVLGRISDSRLVDKVLYLLSYEGEDCFDCDDQSKARLSSIKVESGAAVQKISEVIFETKENLRRPPSAYFGKKQIFVALPPNRKSEGQKGQVHRASYDQASGKLSALKAIDVDGRVQSRWQMNEKDEVLRVFSQSIRRDIEPKLETFKLQGADAEPLAAIDVKLPRPEELKSARFDGDRGYLITFRRTDPLFTFDLSDPAAPKQLGELEIPGWVYHMEARGDRVVGVGYNAAGEKDRLSLTLFDVSDLKAPKVLTRVNFGGRYANFAERQDQIHKSVSLLKKEKMILVPYLSGNFDEDDEPEGDDSVGDVSEDESAMPSSGLKGYGGSRDDCSGGLLSAIQIFDWEESKVTRRGAAPVEGGAHRSFLHKKKLIALSDEEIAAYDIADRNKPKRLDGEKISVNASRLVRMGDHTVRFTQGWWGSGNQLEVVRHDAVDKAAALATMSLGKLDKDACSDGRDIVVRELFANGDKLYVLFDSWRSDYRKSRVAVVDLADPSKPKVLGTAKVDRPRSRPTSYLGRTKVESEVFGALKDRVVVASTRYSYDEEDDSRSMKTVFSVLRLDPSKGLVKEAELKRKGTHYAGGLIAAGDELGSWHARKTDKPGQLKFYYDRFYVDASGTFQHRAVNVPGAPLGVDSKHKRLLTMDFEIEKVDLDPVACQKHVKFHEWDWENSKCLLLQSKLTQVEIPEKAAAKKLDASDVIGPDHVQRSVFFHADRVFATASASKDKEGSIRVVAGLDASAALKSSRFESKDDVRRLKPLHGASVLERVSRRELRVLDASQLDAIQSRSYEVPYRWCKDVHLDQAQLQCAMGRFGVSLLDPKP